jgi:hypothetical protein
MACPFSLQAYPLQILAAAVQRRGSPAPAEMHAAPESMMLTVVELSLFDGVAEALRGLVPGDLGQLRYQVRRYGIKVWFGDEQPPREHYEAQVIDPRHVAQARVLALEVGFHAEYPRVVDNDAVLSHLLAHERRWRRLIGKEAVAGPFLGRPDPWRRVSEAWPDPDLSSVDLAFELADRLTDYAMALEPLRRGS